MYKQQQITQSQLLAKYEDRLSRIESNSSLNDSQINLSKEKIKNWFEIKENLLLGKIEANQLTTQSVERRQEKINLIRKHEQEMLYDHQLITYKKQIKSRQKQGGKRELQYLMLKNPQRQTNTKNQEIDESLQKLLLTKEYLKHQHGWQFQKKPITNDSEEAENISDFLRNHKIKFDLLENEVYHSQQPLSLRKYEQYFPDFTKFESLTHKANKEVLSRRFDGVTTLLPNIGKEILNIPSVNMKMGQSKISKHPLTSQQIPTSSPKRKGIQFGFGEEILVNSVSSKPLTRRHSRSENESQQKAKKKVIEGSTSMSQDRSFKFKSIQKIKYPNNEIDTIKEITKTVKMLDKTTVHKRMIEKIIERSQSILGRLEREKRREQQEYKFNRIKEVQKEYLEKGALSKEGKQRLEKSLENIAACFIPTERKQLLLFDYYKKKF